MFELFLQGAQFGCDAGELLGSAGAFAFCGFGSLGGGGGGALGLVNAVLNFALGDPYGVEAGESFARFRVACGETRGDDF